MRWVPALTWAAGSRCDISAARRTSARVTAMRAAARLGLSSASATSAMRTPQFHAQDDGIAIRRRQPLERGFVALQRFPADRRFERRGIGRRLVGIEIAVGRRSAWRI